MTSLSALLRNSIAQHAAAGRTAIDDVSYAELGALIDGYASGALLAGVQRGEIVGIVASRGVEAVALFLGLMQAGGCASFMEPKLSADALRTRMNAVGMKRLLVDPAHAGLADGIREAGFDVTASATLLQRRHRDFPALSSGDLAMVQFTSGSTGQPKGVPLTHGNLLSNAHGVLDRTGVTPADRLLHVMPLHHTNGINNQVIVPLIAGAHIVLADRFSTEKIEEQIAELRITYMTGVPTMYSRILPHLQDRSKLATLRFLRCGSAPITVALHEQIEAAFGVPLVVSYGLSEATCTSTMNPPAARRVGSVGTVLAGQEVKLFNPGSDHESAPDTEGEIRIAGPSVMSGYIGEDEQPLRNGWLCTGDLGRFDADGYLSVTGRIKDVIIRGGENLSPQLIESVLVQHSAVRACCVVGMPHADLGEVPVAFVTLHEGTAAKDSELMAFVGERLSRIYIPAQVRVVDALPENSVGKVDRKALRKSLEAV
jgi:acyl-CoA synthetase (AMP-forming)/AMP-acid ligase II